MLSGFLKKLGASFIEAPARVADDSSLAVQDSHARYQEATSKGNVYFAALNAGNASAYVGAAAGIPLVGVMNPSNTGKLLVPIAVVFGSRVTGTGAVGVCLEVYGGPSVLPTGTVTTPINVLSMVATGSVARAYVNTAMTGSTALTFIMSPFTYGTLNATAAMNVINGWVDLGGVVPVIPGNMLALGLPIATVAATFNCTLFWEEIAIPA